MKRYHRRKECGTSGKIQILIRSYYNGEEKGTIESENGQKIDKENY